MAVKIELIRYEVDEAMLGSDFDSEKYNLKDFCETLQKLCEEQCLFFKIIPILDSYNGASHNYGYFGINYDNWSPHWNKSEDIPFWDAYEQYINDYEQDLLNQISEDDLTEIPEKLREAIITKRDKPEDFTKEMYQNIYHNLIHKDVEKFDKFSKKYAQKTKLSRIFNQIDI